MSWTNLETVRKHLQETGIAATVVENEEYVLIGETEVQLAHRSLSSASEEVKTIDLANPYSEGPKVLTGTNLTNLAHQDLVPETIVVTGDQALDTVYVEGTDYVVSYEMGKIRRTSDSSIPAAAPSTSGISISPCTPAIPTMRSITATVS